MSSQKGNQRALIHGGEGARLRIQQGEELVGAGRDAELAVYDELAESGRYSIVVRNAARLQAAADLFWNAVNMAAQEGDLQRLDGYIKRFGWLASSALRAWTQVRDEERSTPPMLNYDEFVERLKTGGGDAE